MSPKTLMLHCSSPAAEPAQPGVGFQIYQETGLTPAPTARTAAFVDNGFASRAGKKMTDDKENQLRSMPPAASGARPTEDDEPMAVDFVNIPQFLN